MALAFEHLSWWLWSGKQKQKPEVPNGASLKATIDSGLSESETLKFPLSQIGNMKSYSRRVKRKRHSREERKLDKEYDVVIVPSDGGCFSGSDSEDSDWSIGWLEPHGSGFHSDGDPDDSFAVLVPCYGHGHGVPKVQSKENFPGTIKNISNMCTGERQKIMEDWRSSLQTI